MMGEPLGCVLLGHLVKLPIGAGGEGTGSVIDGAKDELAKGDGPSFGVAGFKSNELVGENFG